MAKLYKFLLDAGLLRLFDREFLRLPLVPELNGTKGLNISSYTSVAFDYYLCSYRHVIEESDVLDWFTQTGGEAVRTSKGFWGRKPL